MKKSLITILIIFLAITSGLSFVTAQNETEIRITNSEEENRSRIGEEVTAVEKGDFITDFDDGYSGYCINYMKHDAEIGDEFIVEDTSHATHKNTGESVGNYLKVYFVDYYEEAMKSEVVTQHTIWHFTDDFNGWRIDYDLIDDIKATATTKTIPDHGAVRQINNTTEAVFDFEVLKTGNPQNQNFFGYKITYRDIIKEIMTPNETQENPFFESFHPENSLSSQQNSALNENETAGRKEDKSQLQNGEDENLTQKNKTMLKKDEAKKSTDGHATVSKENNHKTSSYIENDENETPSMQSMSLSKHVTGHGRAIGLAAFVLILCFIAIKYIRDE